MTTSETELQNHYLSKTRFSLISTYLLTEPFVSIFALLTIILTKYMGASPFQIAAFTMLKPTVSVFSFYWGFHVSQKPKTLRSNLLFANFFSVLPFLLFPFFDSIWFLIVASACYMLFSRAAVPALMEILKINLPKQTYEKLFSLASTLAYGSGVIIGIVIGQIMDHDQNSWKMLFFISACLVMVSVFIQSRLPIRREEKGQSTTPDTIYKWLLHPLKESFSLIRRRPDFAHFQWGFMIAMIGLMLAMPAIPFFLTDIQVSFTELMISFNICKGLGFTLSSPFWTKGLKYFNINQLSNAICVGFGAFYFFMLLAAYGVGFLFFAYLLYGVVQGGSHLIWHLSGPMFSGNDDSSPYSAVNVLMVGLRGAVVPPIGALFCSLLGPQMTIGIGMLICFYGGYYLISKKPQIETLQT